MKVLNACAKAVESNSSIYLQNASGFSNVDIDTIVSPHSFEQARRASKAVCQAVDEMYKTATTHEVTFMFDDHQGYRNVFCCVRPPGHHIGTNGHINNPNNSNVSQGFCILNNVAIAAAYARSQYSLFKRIAILDIDIHHGNGTEDCIQHLCPCEKTTVNCVENMEVRQEYEVIFNNRHKSYQYKPWLNEDDSKNVFFASIHGYGKLTPAGIDYFYPGSGHSPNKVDYVKNEVSGIEFTV